VLVGECDVTCDPRRRRDRQLPRPHTPSTAIDIIRRIKNVNKLRQAKQPCMGNPSGGTRPRESDASTGICSIRLKENVTWSQNTKFIKDIIYIENLKFSLYLLNLYYLTIKDIIYIIYISKLSCSCSLNARPS